MTGPDRLALSVDLEPNKDGTLDGVRDAMEWFDRTVGRGTVFTTYRIATELPELVEELHRDHEIGVHVHPREFGHDHDELARLSAERQSGLIATTRTAVAEAIGVDPDTIRSFRAGNHSVSEETVDVLRRGFDVDASVHVRYDDSLPKRVTRRTDPFEWDGLVEVPTTYALLPVSSRCCLRALAAGAITATASTLRTDSWFCPGERAIRHLFSSSSVVSMYMHPYDATDYHGGLENCGSVFRARIGRLLDAVPVESIGITELANDLPDGQ